MVTLVTFRVRGDTPANWTAANPVLADREIAVEKGTRKIKIGDGVTAWNDLPYAGGAESEPDTSALLTKTAAASFVGFGSASNLPVFTNAKMVAKRFAALPLGTTDIYTCPAGKRAAIVYTSGFNPTAGAINWRLMIKVGATYYATAGLSATGAGAALSASTSVTIEAGESFAFETNAANLNAWFKIIEFDDTSNYRTRRILGPVAGANTLYTAPAGKVAMVHPISLTVLASAQQLVGAAKTAGFTMTTHGTAAGSLATSTATQSAPAATVAINGGSAAVAPSSLGATESIVVVTSAAAADAMIWVNISEWDA